ncbi:hypothetical protein [Paraburkholderia diazotrophica]|uniref:Uncharacterized protein n=1 Tax=Paraburkholderia diazotrophica TaxID=667676 RepID=A0A1H6QLB2_9BURK|nr:hypothetical protein [Paraburkholderia diazotrophica]SEI41774.1 hypothetical protein SAMN05192539_1001276 [Paraburkholderia diazotrophica]
MSTKHTPGPWTAKDESGMYFCEHDWHANNDSVSLTTSAPVHANGQVVALVVSEDWNDAKIDANARLIAASPLMLEKLYACKAMCGRIIDQHGGVLGGIDFHALAIGVDAAIAAATGA